MKHADVEALRKVDALDAKAAKLRRELRELPEELTRHKEQAKVLAARLQAVHDEQKKLQREIDKLALDVKANEEQIKKYQIQQNSAKTNEEYATLRRQIEALRKANGEIEDKELALYERIDALKSEEKAAREALASGKKKLEDEEAAVKKELDAIEKELGEILAARAEAEKGVNPGVLALYRRILEKVQNRALAPVVGRTCQGCRMEIPSNDLAMLLAGKEVVSCKSCSRILYLEDDYRAITSTSYSVGEKDRDATSKDGNW